MAERNNAGTTDPRDPTKTAETVVRWTRHAGLLRCTKNHPPAISGWRSRAHPRQPGIIFLGQQPRRLRLIHPSGPRKIQPGAFSLLPFFLATKRKKNPRRQKERRPSGVKRKKTLAEPGGCLNVSPTFASAPPHPFGIVYEARCCNWTRRSDAPRQ